MSDTNHLSKRPLASVLLFLFGLAIGFLAAYLLFNKAGLIDESDIGGRHDFDGQLPSGHQWAPVRSIAGAESNLDAYRRRMAMTNLSVFHANGKPYCIVHDSGTAISYDTGFFRNFAKYRSTADAKYIWALGYYPEICTDTMQNGNATPRLSLFLIPTMRNRDTKNYPRDILDYDSIKNTDGIKYYYPDSVRDKLTPALMAKSLTGSQGYIYDQGTIFP